MKLSTKYHGDIEFKENEVITFNNGVPGFQELKKFILFPVKDNEMFNILHSIENTDVGFVVVSPFSVISDYEFDLDDKRIKELQIKSEEQVMIMNTVTLNSNVKNITANLRAPIVINVEEKLGDQVILSNDKYLVKHPIFEEAS